MTNRTQQDPMLADPRARRAFEEGLLIGDVADTVEALLNSLQLTQHELARRLGVSDGRVSQILSGTGNLRLRTLASIGWALGIRFSFQPEPMVNRVGTPAGSDRLAPEWLTRPEAEAVIHRGQSRLLPGFDLDAPTGALPAFGGDLGVAA